MEFTNERLVPNNYYSHRELYYWHLSRYNYAKQFIEKGDKVLDVACGTGYGTYEMAMIAREVIGVDIDQQTIDFAMENFASSNIKYICSNAKNIGELTDAKFDVCVSFETIEHLDQQSQVVFLNNVVQVLNDSGYFIVSTPNANVYGVDNGSKNEYHLHELHFNEFKDLLEKRFEIVFILGQRKYAGSSIKDVIIKIMDRLRNIIKLRLKKSSGRISQKIADFEFPTFDIHGCLIYVAVCRNPKRNP